MNKGVVLVTRPDPACATTAARLTALGYSPICAPMLTIAPLQPALPDPASLQAVLAASANALPPLPPSFHSVKLLTVGDATAKAARKLGFSHVESAAGDATALAAFTASSCTPSGLPLLLATGRGQGYPLRAALQAAGFIAARAELYAATPAVALPDPARHAWTAASLHAVLFFSAETARAFIRLILAANLAPHAAQAEALAIGQPAAAVLAALPWRHIRVAVRPQQDALLAMLP